MLQPTRSSPAAKRQHAIPPSRFILAPPRDLERIVASQQRPPSCAINEARVHLARRDYANLLCSKGFDCRVQPYRQRALPWEKPAVGAERLPGRRWPNAKSQRSSRPECKPSAARTRRIVRHPPPRLREPPTAVRRFLGRHASAAGGRPLAGRPRWRQTSRVWVRKRYRSGHGRARAGERFAFPDVPHPSRNGLFAHPR